MQFRELELWATDLPALQAFYGGLLGLPIVQAGQALVEFQVGGSLLRFVQAQPGWEGFYHFAFNIPENRLAEASSWLQERVPLIADQTGQTVFPSESWNSDQIYFYDPAGNIGELIARHTLNNGTDEPFSQQHLLNVSEIGVVVEDVPTAAADLQQRFDLNIYKEGSSTFTPLGDEHGLLIVVQQGRIWFPNTGKAAIPAPTRVNGVDVP
jgi:catechol-2,3-dioxygenase